MSNFKEFQILVFDNPNYPNRKVVFVRSNSHQFYIAVNLYNKELIINDNKDTRLYYSSESCCVRPADEKLIKEFFNILLGTSERLTAISHVCAKYGEHKGLLPTMEIFDIVSEVNNHLNVECEISVVAKPYRVNSTLIGQNVGFNMVSPIIKISEGTGVELKVETVNSTSFKIKSVSENHNLRMSELLKVKDDSFFLCECNGYPVLVSMKMFEEIMNKKKVK